MAKHSWISLLLLSAIVAFGSVPDVLGRAPNADQTPRGKTAATQAYVAQSGTLALTFDQAALEALDWSLSLIGKGDARVDGERITFVIEPTSTFTAEMSRGRFQRIQTARIHARGSIMIADPMGRVSIGNPVLSPTPGGGWTITGGLALGTDEAVSINVTMTAEDYDPANARIRLAGVLSVGESLARALGVADLAGTTIGSLSAELHAAPTDREPIVTREPEPTASQGDVAGRIGPDIIVAVLYGVLRFGRVGDITAYAVATNACNVGDERASWVASTSAHPVIMQNMYRLRDNQFEQIGMSWMKHGFYAVSGSTCGPCTDYTNGTELGVGCSDPYSASLNGVQNNMSLISDVNPHTGVFPYPWTAPPADPIIGRRLQVHDADLDPSLNLGASYFVQGHYIAADEAAAGNGNNSASYREVAVTESDDYVYNVSVAGFTQREQPAIRAWQDTDPDVSEVDIQIPGEGLLILAAKAVNLGPGSWHYEYALQNLNSDRSCGSFSVPIPAGASVTNVGFHDIDYHSGDPYDGTDWEAVVSADAVTWSTEPYEQNINANALRWSTLYNFRFDIDVEPGGLTVRLGLFKPGTPQNVSATIIGPAGAPPVCGDGAVHGAEQCDPPDDVHCDTNCRWICGDGVVQDTESCDPPDPVHCNQQCQWVCGDGVIQSGETCDDGGESSTCDADCTPVECGDGTINAAAGEQCDDRGETANCDADCTLVECGDGIVNTRAGEQCDPPDGVTCDTTCRQISEDSCQRAAPICPGQHSGSTSNATSDGAATCGMSTDSPDVWFTYTPAAAGLVVVDTCESTFDTVLSIHTGCPGTDVNQASCNDDACDYQSRITFLADAGVTYIIRLSGYGGLSGDFTLSLSGPPCRLCTTDEECPDTGNPCTTNQCVLSFCIENTTSGPCDDGDPCTTGDVCSGGTCTGELSLPACNHPTQCTDCNDNGVRDDCEGLADCDGNGIPDTCEFTDCNNNGVADICDIAGGTSSDCDGGPVGSIDDGNSRFTVYCAPCHGSIGSGGPGPNIQNRDRIEIRNTLLPPTIHAGGAFLQFTEQDFADIEAFLSTGGARGRPDRIPDQCQALIDCDEDGASDGCELEAGTQIDLDHNGRPDDCLLKGDFDRNDIVDLDDYWFMELCQSLSGPGLQPPFAECMATFDFDGDDDVDLYDFSAFAVVCTGPEDTSVKPTLQGLDPNKPLTLPFEVQVAFNDDTVFFHTSWEGNRGETHDYFHYTNGAWQREGGPRRDAQATIDLDPVRGATNLNSTIYESRMTFMLNDPGGPNAVAGFREFGCMLTCHNDSRAMPLWQQADGEVHKYLGDDRPGRLDLWHHRLHRSNPLGQSDDQWVGRRIGGEGDGGGGSRHGDAGTGPYATAGFGDGTPQWIFDDTTTGGMFAFAFQDLFETPLRYFVHPDAVDAGPSGSHPVGIDYAVALARGYVPGEGDTVPRRRLRLTTGSRGDISAAETTFTPSPGNPLWGRWSSQLQRALDTGYSDDTNMAPEAIYEIAFAVHSGMVAGRDHYVSFPYTLSLNGPSADIQAVNVLGTGREPIPDFSDTQTFPVTRINLFLPGITSYEFLTGQNAGLDFIDPRTDAAVDQNHAGATALLNQGIGCRDCHTVKSSEVFIPTQPGGFFGGPMELLVPLRGGVHTPTPLPPP